MKKAAWKYYNQQNLDDVHIMSTLGLTGKDVEEIGNIYHSEITEAGYTADLYINSESGRINRKIAKVYSYNPQNKINLPDLREGRFPENASECVVDYSFHSSETPEIGEKITFEASAGDELSDTLNRAEYTVVGYVQMPMYIAFERGTTSVGNGVINGFVLVPEENFSMEVYTDVYISAEQADELDPFGEDYENLIDEAISAYESLGEVRIENRVSEVTDEAYEEINDAKAEIADAERELEDGRKELADAEKKAEDGKREIADGEKELEDGRKELADAEAELEDGRKEIADAEAELDNGRKEIADAEAEFAKGREKLADGEKELENGRKKLADAEAELEKGRKEAAAGEKELEDGRKKLADAEAELENGRKEYEKGQSDYNEGVTAREGLDSAAEQLDNIIAAYETGTADEAVVLQTADAFEQSGLFAGDETFVQLLTGYMTISAEHDDGTKAASRSGLEQYAAGLREKLAETDAALSSAEAELKAAKEELDKGEAELEKARLELSDNEKKLSDAKKEIADGEKEFFNAKKEFAENEKKIADAEQELADREQELADAKKELADGERELADAKQELADGEKEVADAERELADGERELADAKQELADGEKEIADAKKDIADAEIEIADAEVEITEAEKDIAEAVKDAKWYVFSRNDYYPYFSHYGEDCDRVDAIAAVFPVFFILVAALVCWTTMSRMVEEQRIQIGTLKALGYGKFSIMSQYILYALAASIPGSLIGLLIGFKVIPAVIFVCYQSMYAQPSIDTPFIWSYAIGCTAVACLCTAVSSLYSCRKELDSRPAQLMRAKPPKNGKRIFMERIKFIWNRLKFTHKVTFRNIFRYKSRVLMTVIGVGGCTALLLTGFGLRYSIISIVDRQFVDIFKYDALIAVDEDKADFDEITADAFGTGVVSESMNAMQKVCDIYNSSGDSAEVYLVVPEDTEMLKKFVGLHERISKKELEIEEDGIVINEKLSRILSVKEGDEVYFNDGYGVKVTSVAENYTFNYVYMSASAYEKAGFENGVRNNIIYVNMNDITAEDELSGAIVNREDVLAVTYSAGGGDSFRDLVSSLSLIVVVIIVSAGALAFAVMFNLANINVNERIHELATIKVLGFYDGEVASYIYRENTISALLGMLAGLVMGIFLEAFVIKTAEVDAVMFAPDIPAYCFLAAAGMTILFTVVVNVFLYFRLKKIDMAASLKAIE